LGGSSMTFNYGAPAGMSEAEAKAKLATMGNRKAISSDDFNLDS